MSLGMRIKEARKSKNLSQEELGRMIGAAKSTISSYEIDKARPNGKKTALIMDVLNVTANYLFQDEMKNDPDFITLSPSEENLIKKYRKLDEYGKNIIASVLDVENSRLYDDEMTYEGTMIQSEQKLNLLAEIKPENPDKEQKIMEKIIDAKDNIMEG